MSDNKKVLSTSEKIVPFFVPWGLELKFKDLPEKVGLRYQSKIKLFPLIDIVTSKKLILSPPISVVNWRHG